MSIYKPFSQKLHDKFDGPARIAVSSFLRTNGYTVGPQEQYDIDLVAVKDGIKYLHEVEVKEVWNRAWPAYWKTLHIPLRKKKFIQQGKDFTFWVLNAGLDKAWITFSYDVKDAPVVFLKNKEEPGGGYFFDVPIHKCQLIDLTVPL